MMYLIRGNHSTCIFLILQIVWDGFHQAKDNSDSGWVYGSYLKQESYKQMVAYGYWMLLKISF